MLILRYLDPGIGIAVTSGLGAILAAFFLGFFGILAGFFKKIFKFIKKHRKSLLIFLLIIVILIITGVIMNMKESDFNKKIIILAYDGLSPDIIESLIEQGDLPNFSRLKEKGSYRHLLTSNPSQSPVAWSVFATGQNPGKNGVYDFIVRDPANYSLKLSLSNIVKEKPQQVIKSKCFWNYTSDKKVNTVLLGHPMTFPPDQIYGKMLSGMGVPDILGTEGTFTFYTSEILKKPKDTVGNVYGLAYDREVDFNLIGPRLASSKDVDNLKVKGKLTIKDKISALVKYQDREVELKVGQWSQWQEVVFNPGFLKKIKGIFKFYLVETKPQIKLYISPINFDPRVPFFKISHPNNYARELSDKLGLFYTMGMPIDVWPVNEGIMDEKALIEQADLILREKKAMLDFELSRLNKGILYAYFESPDIIQHMFWRYRDSQHPLYEEDAPQVYKEIIINWYKKLDLILGEVMKRIKEDDTLIVLSDHGCDTFRRSVNINTWLRENGYLQLKDPDAYSGEGLLADIDWSKTRAYAIGFGAIYINQKNREAEGVIEKGSQTEGLKKELSKELKQWIDDKDNSLVISNVYSREDIFWGDYINEAPDLYIGFNRGFRASWQTVLGAVPEDLIEDNLKKWSGTHLIDPVFVPGVIFTNKKITKKDPSLYDFAPTLLSIVGFSKDEIKKCDFDGQPLF